jgi:MGT family glycosyltransferase
VNRYLFTTMDTNDLGLLTRSLPIASELKQRGHQMSFCHPEEAPRQLISEAGFDNLALAPLPYELIVERMIESSTAEIWDVDHLMYNTGMWNKKFIRANIDAYTEMIKVFQPDVIVDFFNPYACIAAKVNHKPLITVIQADFHPESQGFIWWKETPRDLPTPIPATNTVLSEYHLPSIRKISELLVGDLTLVLGMLETDPLPETANITYIGPILWQRHDQKLPDWIETLDREQPVVWLYPGNLEYMSGTSTAYDSKVVLQACIQALSNEYIQVILTTGYHSLPQEFIPLPSNFHHEAFVPGLAMAERSDLLLHHGGYGSCQTGLYTGKPALIIPTYSERESNARRIAAQRAGDYVIPKTDSTGRIKEVSGADVRIKVHNILSDLSFAQNAKRISERMKTYGGASEAARLIESFKKG